MLSELAACSDWKDQSRAAYKIYCSALGGGTNRLTGLAFGAVTRHGKPIDRLSRSWPQAEAVKAAIASGERTALDVAEAAWSGPANAPEATLRVREFLLSLPGLGPARADRTMGELGIAASKRVGGLGVRQRASLRSGS